MPLWLPDQRHFGSVPQDFELNRDSPQARGMVGYWPLNEAGGLTARDLSGNGNDGTLTNMDPATDWVVSERGRCLDFDGANDHVSVPIAGTPLDITTDQVSLGVWAKAPAAPSSSDYLLGAASDDVKNGYCLNAQSNGTDVRFIIGDGTYHLLVRPINEPWTQWNHFAAVYNGTDMRLYQNGVQLGAPLAETGNMTSGSNPFHIGTVGAGGSLCWGGRLCNVCIYNRALSASEVFAIYNAPTRWELRQPKSRISYFCTSGEAAPAGLDIPIAMHHYNQMMGAN